MTRESGRKWDGRSRIPTEAYKQNYNRIFGNKDKESRSGIGDKKNNRKAKDVVR